MKLYYKNKEDYIPIAFKKIIKKNWNKSLIIVKVGDENHVPNCQDFDDIMDALNSSDALEDLDEASFLLTSLDMSFKKIYDMEKRK